MASDALTEVACMQTGPQAPTLGVASLVKGSASEAGPRGYRVPPGSLHLELQLLVAHMSFPRGAASAAARVQGLLVGPPSRRTAGLPGSDVPSNAGTS